MLKPCLLFTLPCQIHVVDFRIYVNICIILHYFYVKCEGIYTYARKGTLLYRSPYYILETFNVDTAQRRYFSFSYLSEFIYFVCFQNCKTLWILSGNFKTVLIVLSPAIFLRMLYVYDLVRHAVCFRLTIWHDLLQLGKSSTDSPGGLFL